MAFKNFTKKKEIKLEQDKDKVLKKMIESEKTRQFDQFSQVYFNKIKFYMNSNYEL